MERCYESTLMPSRPLFSVPSDRNSADTTGFETAAKMFMLYQVAGFIWCAFVPGDVQKVSGSRNEFSELDWSN